MSIDLCTSYDDGNVIFARIVSKIDYAHYSIGILLISREKFKDSFFINTRFLINLIDRSCIDVNISRKKDEQNPNRFAVE